MLLSNGSWSTLATFPSKLDMNYTVTGLSPNTSYSFRVVTSVSVTVISSIVNSPSQVATASTTSLPVSHQQNGFSSTDTVVVIVVLLVITLGAIIAMRRKRE